jgi:hypothetical protein
VPIYATISGELFRFGQDLMTLKEKLEKQMENKVLQQADIAKLKSARDE